MATIRLDIEALDAADLYDTLQALADGPRPSTEGGLYAQEYGVTVAANKEPETEGERQKRTRRTKAEMEAARAAEAGQGSSGSATGASTDSAEATLGQQLSSEPLDPFAEQVRQSAAETKTDDAPATKEQVRAAMAAYMGGNPPKHTAKDLSALLTRVAGVPNLGSLDAKDYGKVLAAIKEAE